MSSLQPSPKSSKPASEVEQTDLADEGLPRLFERHLLLKRIAKGGMGEVFLATSAGAIDGAERPCVLKVIRREHAEDSSFLARFLDEARIQAQLEHPGVVRVLFASHDESGKPYVVLEHVEGRNLSEVRLRVQQLGVRLAWPDAIAIAVGLTEALSHIHERTDATGKPLSIVHRDLSPQNVMVGYGGDVKVIDFGTARGQNRRCHTVSGIVYAKPGYVAPEVANNQAGGIPADLYAVGVMLWELLAGRRFITGDAAEHLAAVAAGTKVLVPIATMLDAPPELDAICQRLTATRIEDRFESASEACNDLAQLLKRAPSTSDGQRSVRVRISQLMQRLYPAEPTRTRAEFQRLVAAARRIEPPASAIAPSPSPAPADEPEPVEPQLLDGTRFSLGERIGEGASSVVYDATHVDLGRRVALKLYTASTTREAIEEFRTEARHVASISHDNIVKVYDFGLTTSGQAYLSMERLDGASMDRRIQSLGPLDWQSALLLSVQICRALEAAHASEVIHGDLKPANLFLTDQGTLKLLDFGVSALRRSQPPSDGAESFSLKGTPEYLAPEQLRGGPASIRSDLYALGVVLFEMLTASRPHEADSLAALLGQKLEGRVEAPSKRAAASRVPKAVDRLCLRLLALEPEERFASAGEVRLAIERILDSEADGRRRAGRSVRAAAGAITISLGLAALLAIPGARQRTQELGEHLAQQSIAFAAHAQVPAMARVVGKLQLQSEQAIALALNHQDTSTKLAETSTQSDGERDASVNVSSPATNPMPHSLVATTRDDEPRRVAGTQDGLPTTTPISVAKRERDEAATTSSSVTPARRSANDEASRMGKALKESKPLLALDIARNATPASRQNPQLFKHWVSAATSTGAWGEARRAAKELVRLESSPENLLALVNLERRTGHLEDARKTLERVLATYPSNAEAKALNTRLNTSARVAVR